MSGWTWWGGQNYLSSLTFLVPSPRGEWGLPVYEVLTLARTARLCPHTPQTAAPQLPLRPGAHALVDAGHPLDSGPGQETPGPQMPPDPQTCVSSMLILASSCGVDLSLAVGPFCWSLYPAKLSPTKTKQNSNCPDMRFPPLPASLHLSQLT